MPLSNGSLITATGLNSLSTALTTAVKTAEIGGDYIKDLVGKSNGFTVIRFKQNDLQVGEEYKFRFVSPDDYDITVAGLTLTFEAVPAAGSVDFSCRVNGSTGDLENDLPVDDNLFLTQPVSNVEDQPLTPATGEVLNDLMHIRAVGGSQIQHSDRYASFLFDQDNPCNTLLKGSSYDVTMKVYQNPAVFGTDHTLEIFMVLQTKLRRN